MGRPTQWGVLFDIAADIVARAHEAVGSFTWSFGGGTALMLQINHRESHDVDLFIDDPQILPFLNPATQGYALPKQPDEYDTDGTRMIKLVYEEIGEIDFICCADITEAPSGSAHVRGIDVEMETPAEIAGKKIYYRGSHIQPRDMFDIAAIGETLGDAYVIDALRQCGEDRCRSALSAVRNWDPDAARAVMSSLMLREHTRHIPEQAVDITRSLLERSLS